MAFRQYKTKAGQRHNIDLSDDCSLNSIPFGWHGSYNQRALCVRIFCNASSFEKMRTKSIPNILKVKYITREKNTLQERDYDWEDPNVSRSVEEFYQFIKCHVVAFEQREVKTSQWKDITSMIEILNYKYKKIDQVDRWTTDLLMSLEEYNKRLETLSTVSQKFIGTFRTALQCDMKNGLAKMWMNMFVTVLLDSRHQDVLCVNPSQHCNTNTQVEFFCNDELYNKSYCSISDTSDLPLSLESLNLDSPSSSSSSSAVSGSSGSTGKYMFTMKRHTIVPDFCVLLSKFPGMFPLVVELKPAGKESDGFFQNVQQMLSKLFFQDVVFGMVISPISYQMSVIMKLNGKIRFASTGSISLVSTGADVVQLDMEKLNVMCTFIYSALKWSLDTFCMIEKKVDFEEKEGSENPTNK